MAYPSSIPLLSNGLDVSAEDLNLTISPLIDAVTYLKANLDVYEADGSLTAIRIKNQTLPGAAVPGTPVYHDGTSWQVAQAIALDVGATEVNPSSFILGIVETGSTVLLAGRSTALTGTQLQLEPNEVFTAGPYYLSASHAGCATKTKPAVAVYIGSFFSTFSVVMPCIRDNADAHVHHAIPLSNKAAGFVFATGVGESRTYTLFGYKHDADTDDSTPGYATPVLCGAFNLGSNLTYVITVATVSTDYVFSWTAGSYSGTLTVDTDELYDVIHTLDGARGVNVFFRRPTGTDDTATVFADATWTLTLPEAGIGWIPADSGGPTPLVLFDMPANIIEAGTLANYVYNTGYDAAINDFYPPTPLGTAAYLFNGAELCEATKFKNSSFALTYDTILWSDTTLRPWIHEEEEGATEPQSMFCFVRRSSGNTGTVTSLTSGTNSPIRFKAKGSTAEASVGDLEAYLDLTLTAADTAAVGYNVVKGAQDNALLMGPVVEKIIPGEGLELVPVRGSPTGQGTVQMRLASAVGLAGPFDNISLENAKQNKVGMFTYVSIPAKTTVAGPGYGFTANFQIPYKDEGLTPSKYKVRVYGTVFGDKSITDGVQKTCSINFGYSVLPDDTEGTYAISLEEAKNAAATRSISLTLPIGYTAYDPIRISTDTGEVLGEDIPADGEMDAYLTWGIDVRPGFTVGIKFEAGTGAADYTGNVGFMNLRWELVKIEA